MAKIILIVLVVSLSVVLGWLFWGHFSVEIANWALAGEEIAVAGAWGDSFGAFTAAFNALGFAAILGTLLLQGRSLHRQQDDQHYQQFDSSFFSLLTLVRSLRENIRFRHSVEYLAQKKGVVQPTSRSTKYGLEAVTAAAREIRYWLGRQKKAGQDISEANIAAIYSTYIHKRNENRIAAYLRTIGVILGRIKNDGVLDAKEKEYYVSIIRGVLTTYELGLLAINGLRPSEKEIFGLIVEFRLLKYMSDGLLRRTLEKFYPAAAFDGKLTSGEPDIPESEEESEIEPDSNHQPPQ